MIKLVPAKEADYSLIVDWVNAHDSDFIVQWAGLTYQYPLRKMCTDQRRETFGTESK